MGYLKTKRRSRLSLAFKLLKPIPPKTTCPKGFA